MCDWRVLRLGCVGRGVGGRDGWMVLWWLACVVFAGLCSKGFEVWVGYGVLVCLIWVCLVVLVGLLGIGFAGWCMEERSGCFGLRGFSFVGVGMGAGESRAC